MKQIVRLNQRDIKNMIYEYVKKIIKEGLGDNEDILNLVRSMRSNVIDLSEDGYGVLYVDYYPETNELFVS